MVRRWILVLGGAGFMLLVSYHTDILTSVPWEEYLPEHPRKRFKNEPWDSATQMSSTSQPWTSSRIVQSLSTEVSIHTIKIEEPTTEKKKKAKVTEDDSQTCLRSLVSVQYGGRFGNQFMEWASALGVARRLDAMLPNDQRRVVALPRNLWKSLRNVFDGLNVTSLADEIRKRKTRDGAASCGEIFPQADDIAAETTPGWQKAFYDPQRVAGNKSVVLQKWVAFPPAVQSVADELHRTLRFKKKFRDPAASRLRSLAHQVTELEAQNTSSSEVVVVGIHARRTDYAGWLKHRIQRKPANETYFVHALQWMVWSLRTGAGNRGCVTPKLSSPSPQRVPSMSLTDYKSSSEAFVTPPPSQTLPVHPLIAVAVVSDDMRWANDTLIPALNKYIGEEKVTGIHVFTAGSSDAMVDLALLTLCNHTIISYGTYGAMGAILSGGCTVVFDLQHPSYVTLALARYLPNWFIMS